MVEESEDQEPDGGDSSGTMRKWLKFGGPLVVLVLAATIALNYFREPASPEEMQGEEALTSGAAESAITAPAGASFTAEGQTVAAQELSNQNAICGMLSDPTLVPGCSDDANLTIFGVFLIALLVSVLTLLVASLLRRLFSGGSQSSAALEEYDFMNAPFNSKQLEEADELQAYRGKSVSEVITMLARTVVRLEREIKELKADKGGGIDTPKPVVQSAKKEFPAQTEAAGYSDPAPEQTSANKELERPSYRDSSIAKATPAAPTSPAEPHAQPSGGKLRGSHFERQLVQGLANATSPADYKALAESVGATYMMNSVTSDASKLFEDPTDRFWLVPDPNSSGFAYLVPGFTVERTWHRMRKGETNHPLGYHFNLREGSDFELLKPAIMERKSTGDWKLLDKGEVSGL